MARERKLTVGVINITMHPHSPALYVELLRAAKNLKSTAELGSRQTALINKVSPFEVGAKSSAPLMSGTLVRFQNIDMDGPWFDTSSEELAQQEDLDEINIPANLKPNSSLYDFVFYPDRHLLFYEMESKDAKITPLQMEKAISRILNHPRLQKKYGQIEVTNIPEIDKLEEALKDTKISNLRLVVTRPNADHFDDIERTFLQNMNFEHVSELIQEKKAIKGQSLQLSEQTLELTKIAAKNGHVNLKGHEASGKPVQYSTKSHPLKITDYYDGGKETTLSFLVKLAKRYLGLGT